MIFGHPWPGEGTTELLGTTTPFVILHLEIGKGLLKRGALLTAAYPSLTRWMAIIWWRFGVRHA